MSNILGTQIMNLSVPIQARRGIPFDLKNTAALPVTLLVVSEYEQPHIFLHNLLTPLNWTLYSAFSAGHAADLLARSDVAVVLFDSDLTDGNWKTLLEQTHTRQKPPRLIVFSRYADVALWGEVLNLGAYDLLVYPFDSQEVIRATALAWESWAREGHRSKSPDTPRHQMTAPMRDRAERQSGSLESLRKAAGL